MVLFAPTRAPTRNRLGGGAHASVGPIAIRCLIPPVVVSPHQYHPPSQVLTLAKAIEDAGATIINTGIGWHEARVQTRPQPSYGHTPVHPPPCTPGSHPVRTPVHAPGRIPVRTHVYTHVHTPVRTPVQTSQTRRGCRPSQPPSLAGASHGSPPAVARSARAKHKNKNNKCVLVPFLVTHHCRPRSPTPPPHPHDPTTLSRTLTSGHREAARRRLAAAGGDEPDQHARDCGAHPSERAGGHGMNGGVKGSRAETNL